MSDREKLDIIAKDEMAQAGPGHDSMNRRGVLKCMAWAGTGNRRCFRGDG